MTKRTPSTQAQAAKAIRADLKRLFPGVKFTVKSDSFSGGDSVDIGWQDGPTDSQVSALTNQYQYGSFDGMTDSYNYTNGRKDIPQVKYVQTHRSYSPERTKEAKDIASARFDHDRANVDDWYIQRYQHYTLLALQSFTCTCGTNPQIGDIFCGECGSPLHDDERRKQEDERQEAQEAGIDAYLQMITN